MRYLRTNTATTITVGPFLDKTDGITPETAITVTGVHITFMVDNAGTPTLAIDADATASGGNNDMVHITNDDAGYYSLELTAAQTNYLGGALLSLNVVGTACPVFHEFTILPANIYDSMIAGTDLFDVSVTQFGGSNITQSGGRPEVNASHIAGSAVSTSSAQIGVNVVNAGGTAWGSGAITAGSIAADAITAAKIADNAIDLATFAADAKALFGVIAFGTAQSVTGTTIRLASAETFATSEIIGATVIIRSASTGAGQARVITAYDGTTDTATVDTWTTTPTGTITYVVIATAPGSTSAPIAANVTQFAGSAITSASGIPEVKVASIANNAITAAAIATNAIDADAIATDAVTEIQSGLSTLTQANIRTAVGLASANLDTQLTAIDDFIDTEVAAILAAVDTEVAAIKAKTDSLTFTVAGQVDANIQSVNDVTVNGNGAGTPWGP